MNETQLRTTVETYAAKQASLTAQLIKVLLGLWIPWTWANRPDMVNAWAARSAVDVDVALSRARRLARAYQIEQLRAMNALPPTLPPIEDLYPRSGTPIVEVYKRPARQYEQAIREGASLEQAERVLVERLEKLVDADMQATARDENARVRDAAPKVIGFRRVLHPELTKYGPCGLCVVAADQVYAKSDLLELHNGCVCTTAEITTEFDPGRSLTRSDLKAIYEKAGSTYAEDLQRTRVTIRENGELGPILVRDGNEFKDVDRVNSESNRRRVFTPYKRPSKAENVTNWAAMRATSERSIRILQDARANGTNLVSMAPGLPEVQVKDLDHAIEYHRALITRALAHGA